MKRRYYFILVIVSVIVGSVTLYSTVVHTGDRLAKATHGRSNFFWGT
jgi:hypothetical protein